MIDSIVSMAYIGIVSTPLALSYRYSKIFRVTHKEDSSTEGASKLHWDVFSISMDIWSLTKPPTNQHISTNEKLAALVLSEVVVDGDSIHH